MRDIEGIRHLLARNGNPDWSTVGGADALCVASSQNSIDIIELLIQFGAQINGVNKQKISPLVAAAEFAQYEAIEFLIQNGADTELRDRTNRTALLKACLSGQTHVVRLLLDSGANINACTNEGKNALMEAISTNKTEIALLLIDRGIDLAHSDLKNRGSLFWAAFLGNEIVTRSLLSKDIPDELIVKDVRELMYSSSDADRKVASLIEYGLNIGELIGSDVLFGHMRKKPSAFVETRAAYEATELRRRCGKTNNQIDGVKTQRNAKPDDSIGL